MEIVTFCSYLKLGYKVKVMWINAKNPRGIKLAPRVFIALTSLKKHLITLIRQPLKC